MAVEEDGTVWTVHRTDSRLGVNHLLTTVDQFGSQFPSREYVDHSYFSDYLVGLKSAYRHEIVYPDQSIVVHNPLIYHLVVLMNVLR